jgi:lysophospholipase
MAWDDDADSLPYTWNNGTNIWDTYNRAKERGLPFPEIPPVSELLAHNYTLKPVLFGCDTNLTTTRDATSPIVAYFANSPYSWYSNYSWATGNMSHTEFDSILENSFNLLTQANGTLNKSWVDCLGCAAIDRSLQRMDIQRPQICEDCFQEHCWDGRITEGVPEGFVLDPVLALDPSLSYVEWSEIHPNS